MCNTNYVNPFFIVGCPRSGTTLLQLLINSNSDICIPPESHIFKRFANSIPFYGNLKDRSNLEHLVTDILNDGPIQEWELKISPIEFCDQLEDPSFNGIVQLLFHLYAKREGKTRWADKTPQHCFYLKSIEETFPDAKFINLVRDGRDVAESLKRVYIGPKSIYKIAERWRDYVLEFNRFKENLSPDCYLEVYYENLVSNPNDEINKILIFIGSSTKPNREYKISNLNTEKIDFKGHPHHISVKEKVRSNKIGIFKKYFNSRELEIFESVSRSALSLHRYDLVANSNSNEKLSIMENLRFAFEDNIYRYIRKIFNFNIWPLAKKQILWDAQLVYRRFSRSKF